MPDAATAEPASAEPIRKPRRLARFSMKPVAFISSQLVTAMPLLSPEGPGAAGSGRLLMGAPTAPPRASWGAR